MATEKPEKKNKIKDGKLSEKVNAAIAAGKNVWRKHETLMQALSTLPALFDEDIKNLDEILTSYKLNGGVITYDVATQVWNTSYKDVEISIAFDSSGKKKRYTLQDVTAGTTKKDVIMTIGRVISAHHEQAKRITAKKVFDELLAYLQDDAAKDGMEHILNDVAGNLEVLFNAINGHTKIFDIDLDEVLGKKAK
jgi:hypothetical protein